MAIWGEFGVTKAEANCETRRLVEERLNISVRHLTFEVMVVPGDVFGEPPGKESRQREFWKHDKVTACFRPITKQINQTAYYLIT
jgi:hypothetical protein